MKKFPGTLTRSEEGFHAYVLNEEQRAWLAKWYPTIENQRLYEAMRIGSATLQRMARDLGLKKSKAGLKAIKKRQAAHVKKVCEANGHYERMRGKPMSEACQKGLQRMYEEIRQGKRKTGMQIFAKKHPKRYKQMMKERGERQSMLIRRDRARMLYGLPRKTRIKLVVMTPYTRSQTSHRHNALRRGYVLADTCEEGSGHRYTIYYDNDTKRSKIFERNCVRDGFNFKEWKGD